MNEPTPTTRTTITDIDIPFTRLIAFFVKATLAAIPATIILMLIFLVIAMILGALFGAGPMMRPRYW